MKRTSSPSTPRLGQHFLNNPTVARTLVEAGGVAEGEMVLEIGPGKGALTKELLKTGACVIAIEKDSGLVEELRSIFKTEIEKGTFQLVEKDIRDFTPEEAGLANGSYILAANIPYYITGEIIREFLTTKAQPKTIAILVQKEVAKRIVARDGKESILSLSVKAYGVPRIARIVSRGNFTPPPSVDSAVIIIENVSRSFFAQIDENMFFRVVKAGFAAKRKQLEGNLGAVFGKESVHKSLAYAGIEPKARAEDLPLDSWKNITKILQTTNAPE